MGLWREQMAILGHEQWIRSATSSRSNLLTLRSSSEQQGEMRLCRFMGLQWQETLNLLKCSLYSFTQLKLGEMCASLNLAQNSTTEQWLHAHILQLTILHIKL